jgi:hypothetical protein
VPPPSTAKASCRSLEVPDYQKPADVTDVTTLMEASQSASECHCVQLTPTPSWAEQNRQTEAKNVHQASMDVRDGLTMMAFGPVQDEGGPRFRRDLKVDSKAA